MPIATTEVLDHTQVKHRITRMAWQIYENHIDENNLIIAGIANSGFLLAQLIADELRNISNLDIELHKLILDKKNLLTTTLALEPTPSALEGKSIVVVDDVLNTGSTLIYGVKLFLDHAVAQIHTAVLVDRNHKKFPVKADFKGLSLSTSLKEHVEVKIEQEPYSVIVS